MVGDVMYNEIFSQPEMPFRSGHCAQQTSVSINYYRAEPSSVSQHG